MSARSARRPLPALIFLLALAILAVVVWIRVSQRDTDAQANSAPSCTAPVAQLPANGSVTVTVLNSTTRAGLAKSTLDAFTALGFVAGSYDNTDPVSGVGTITSGPNGVAAAKLVAFYLPGATIAPVDSRQDTSVTVSLGAGFTSVATAAVANAAMAKAGEKQSVAPTPGATTSGATGSPSATSTCTTPAAATPSPSASS